MRYFVIVALISLIATVFALPVSQLKKESNIFYYSKRHNDVSPAPGTYWQGLSDPLVDSSIHYDSGFGNLEFTDSGSTRIPNNNVQPYKRSAPKSFADGMSGGGISDNGGGGGGTPSLL